MPNGKLSVSVIDQETGKVIRLGRMSEKNNGKAFLRMCHFVIRGSPLVGKKVTFEDLEAGLTYIFAEFSPVLNAPFPKIAFDEYIEKLNKKPSDQLGVNVHE